VASDNQTTEREYPPAPMMYTALRFWQAEAARLRVALEQVTQAAEDERYPGTPMAPDDASTSAEKELVCIIERMAAVAAEGLRDA
jgi:hypothetical protein